MNARILVLQHTGFPVPGRFDRRAPRSGWPAFAGALLFAGVLLAFVANAARAQRGGFSEMPGSARGSSLAGSVVAFPGGSDAAYWNPAGLLGLGQREVSFSYADLYGLDLAQHTAVHFAWPIIEKDYVWEEDGLRTVAKPPPATRTFGLLVSSFDGDAGDATYSETQVGLLYAWRLPAGLHAGASLRFLRAKSGVGEIDASGRAFDLGVLRRIGPFDVGLLARNLLASVDWNEGDDEPPPPRVHAGLAWQPAGWPVRLGAEWSGDSGSADYSRMGGGVEWTPVGALALRGGLARRTDVLESVTEPTGGFGLRWRELSVDYGFTSSASGYLGDTHRWSASLGL